MWCLSTCRKSFFTIIFPLAQILECVSNQMTPWNVTRPCCEKLRLHNVEHVLLLFDDKYWCQINQSLKIYMMYKHFSKHFVAFNNRWWYKACHRWNYALLLKQKDLWTDLRTWRIFFNSIFFLKEAFSMEYLRQNGTGLKLLTHLILYRSGYNPVFNNSAISDSRCRGHNTPQKSLWTAQWRAITTASQWLDMNTIWRLSH